MKEIFRVPVQKALDWDTGNNTLREALSNLASNNAPDLQEAEQKCENAGGDFWSDRWLQVSIDGKYFVVYLGEE